ncbi:MAG: hypothetical protein ACR2QT_08375 [Woeseiaceae bacterium]
MKTVRILARKKVATDDRGQTVWVAPIESAELELVSTTMLKRVLESDDEERKQKLRDAAKDKDGILTRNAEDDSFRIIDDTELNAALEAVNQDSGPLRAADVILEPLAETADDDDEELSLVSTMALRQILKTEDEPVESEDDEADKGFNPYDSA